MTTQRVFRIEHSHVTHQDSGAPAGPYSKWVEDPTVKAAAEHMCREHGDVDSRQRPVWDVEDWTGPDGNRLTPAWYYHINRKHVAGFADLASLTDWFEVEHRALLADAGFVLRVLDVDPAAVFTGRKQVAFDPTAATTVEVLDLATV